jgi:hypothetical protein
MSARTSRPSQPTMPHVGMACRTGSWPPGPHPRAVFDVVVLLRHAARNYDDARAYLGIQFDQKWSFRPTPTLLEPS